MYIKRHVETTIERLGSMFGAVLVTGPRQVGKTTMLRNVVGDLPYITLDDPLLVLSARDDPGSFFKRFTPPVVVDEIQCAPNLFPYVKMIVDNDQRKGLFYFSGSQQFRMTRDVSESLAGRLGIANMLGLSLREMRGVPYDGRFVPTADYFSERGRHLEPSSFADIWQAIHRGSMPELAANQEMDWHSFYSSYTKTYIERDVHELAQVGDTVAFLRFMAVMASMSGRLLNLSSVARDVGVSHATAERWLSVLVASDLIYLLQPYHDNAIKRSVKTPKAYFLDTGLAAYLTNWPSPSTLEAGAEAGAFFETFVIGEVVKSYRNAGWNPPLFFYRGKDGKEIDLLIHTNGTIHPLEIKKTSNPKAADIKAFKVLDTLHGARRGSGGIICLYDRLLGLGGDDMVVPVDYL
jgi:predicted AAA+ superfamily ATPase